MASAAAGAGAAAAGAGPAPATGPMMYLKPENAIVAEYLRKRLDVDAPQESAEPDDIRITDFDGARRVEGAGPACIVGRSRRPARLRAGGARASAAAAGSPGAGPLVPPARDGTSTPPLPASPSPSSQRPSSGSRCRRTRSAS